MKKIYIHMMMLAALVVAGAAMTSCQKEEAVTGKFTMTVKATKGGGNAKALSFDPNNEHTLNATWAEDEQVTVHNDSKNADLGGYLEAQSDGSETTLYGTLTGTIANNDWLTLKFRSDNYNNQDGTLEYIAANCDYATATVQVTVDGDGKVHTGNATFTNHQAIIKFTLLNKVNNAAISPSALTVTDGTHTVSLTDIPAATYTANKASNVLYVAFPAANEAKTITLVANDGSDTYSYETASAKTFTNGQYYEITVKMEPAYFTVSANSTNSKVLFAQGNLQAVFAEANNTSCTWQFAPTQYSYIGSATANTAIGNNQVTTAGTVDLFGWVGNSSDFAANGINNNNSPYAYGFQYNEALKSDWCVVANAEELGGHNDWHTPTKDEWVYLFNTRNYASQKYGHGSIDGVNGMIILPDVWVLPVGLSFTSGDQTYTTNSYTIVQWQKMEKNGAVFLPAAGIREASTVNNSQLGAYASSTPSSSLKTYYLQFSGVSGDIYVHPEQNEFRYFGRSVRLARYVN